MTPPTSIAHYNLLERLGEGGIGEVFRARDTKVGRTVALKIVSPDIASDPSRLDPLLEDARAAASLSHPNIATLWEVGGGNGHHYLAYEFTAGPRLREEAGGAPMNPRRALDVAIQIADAVADGHARGIIHGDLRPDTIVVTPKGSAKVLDFGLARWTRGGAIRSRAAHASDTLTADAIPIVSYLSPEQALGSPVDLRSDVFSLGAITYELVTGRSAFAAGTVAHTIVNVIQASLRPASQVNPAVPKELDAVLARALAADAGQRQQSAAALAAELRSVGSALDVRSGDVIGESSVLSIDDTPDRQAAGLLTGSLIAAAAAAAVVWWFLSRS